MTDTIVDDARTTALSTQPEAPKPAARGLWGQLKRGWAVLTSMRTALLLLALLALAAIPGTVIPQRGLDPIKVDNFLAAHPHLGPIMDRLSLFDVFAAPWFAAIYLLLFVSVVGCLVPRIRLHARALLRRPPNAPRRLLRLPASTQWRTEESAEAIGERVHALLRRGHWRVDTRVEDDGAVTVCAEKGYLRETGNLIFHLALVLLLAGIALTGLYGFKGTTLVQEGQGFANAREAYNIFNPSRLFSDANLPPFWFTLNRFSATYAASGQPLTFDAMVHYKSSPTAAAQPYDIRVNHPLNVDGSKVFLVGHGYSLNLSVTNAAGRTVYDGLVPFLPDNQGSGGHGVLRIPDLRPGQLAFTGSFFPTFAANAVGGATSLSPALRNPVVLLAAYRGDLGLNRGIPEPDYSLDISHLTQVGAVRALAPGQHWTLPNGATVRFKGVKTWATFEVAHQPGKRTVLVAAILIVAGLLVSLRVRRRRFWVRAIPAADGAGDRRTVVTAAGLARSDGGGFHEELDGLVRRIGRPQQDPQHPADVESDRSGSERE
ncbi:MAG TPA: cytochrome c biogenesis protein ResB [Mycobacteriales bacterium]|nr:cytochrome c biogenesis protein ResB [Mycobacteriales bacterium]